MLIDDQLDKLTNATAADNNNIKCDIIMTMMLTAMIITTKTNNNEDNIADVKNTFIFIAILLMILRQ